MWRMRPALPQRMFWKSRLPTWPIVARQRTWTRRVSPDGSTVIYKATQPDGTFSLTAVEIDSGRSWTLGETRSVDDQVEWLDDDTILYALHPEGTDGTEVEPQFDIWSLDIAEGSEPELFLPAANSPAAIR